MLSRPPAHRRRSRDPQREGFLGKNRRCSPQVREAISVRNEEPSNENGGAVDADGDEYVVPAGGFASPPMK